MSYVSEVRVGSWMKNQKNLAYLDTGVKETQKKGKKEVLTIYVCMCMFHYSASTTKQILMNTNRLVIITRV